MSNRKAYDEALDQVNTAVTEMGNSTIEALKQAFSLMEKQDQDLAGRIVEGDKAIDEMERRIEHQCLTLLLRQQPVATDLRRVSTALKIVTDIERIGDHAADIAEITETLDSDWASRVPVQADLQAMEQEALHMVENAIAAFVAVDMDGADAVIQQDDAVDELFNRVKHELGSQIARDASQIDTVMDLLMVVKYLERLGDHAVNIAQWVRFLKTGMYRGQQIV